VHTPAEAVIAKIDPAVGTVEAVDKHTCVLETGADSVGTLTVHSGMPDVDFTVSELEELAVCLQELSDRYRRATPRPNGPSR
jgi:hypothetical protein